MKKTLLAILCLTVLPGLALAQTEPQTCFECVMGIYSDLAMTSVSGSIPSGTPTDVYLGVQFDAAGHETGLSGIEFSVSFKPSNQNGFILAGADPIPPGATPIGSPTAPADTSAGTTGTGGMNVAWATCQAGGALMKLTFLSLGANTNEIIQIKHKYPPSSPVWHTPIFTRCNGPTFTTVRVREACFVANPSGNRK